MKKLTLLAAILAALFMAAGCPTDVDNSPGVSTKVTGVSVTPAAADVNQGGERQFEAAVAGTGTYPSTVTWTIVETGIQAGTGIVGGLLTVDANEPAESTLTIKASSTLAGYTHVFGTATVTVKASSSPTVTGVAVEPATADVTQGNDQQFTATVSGTGAYLETVTWTIDGAEANGKTAAGSEITTGGLLKVSAAEPADSVITIKANSAFAGYTDLYGSAEVTVKAIVMPATDVYLASNHTGMTAWWGPDDPPDARQFTQNADGTYEITLITTSTTFYFRFFVKDGTGTTYYYHPASGNFPVNINAPMALNSSPTSSISWMVTYTGEFTIVLDPITMTYVFDVPFTVTGVDVEPSARSIDQGSEFQFSATVLGSYTPQGVNWSIDAAEANGKTAAGSEITSGGLLHISETEPVGPLTIRATSTADTSKSGTAAITVRAGGSAPTVYDVTISPATDVAVRKGRTIQFSVDVDATPDADDTVAWSIVETAASGTGISETGLLTVALGETLSSLTIKATPNEAGFAGLADTVTVAVNPLAFDVWLVGGSPSPSWNIGNAGLKMTHEGDGVFTWTGDFAYNTSNVNQSVKFASNDGTGGTGTPGWENNIWFGAAAAGTALVTDTPLPVIRKTGQGNYWVHDAGGAGNYTITLDTENLTVVFVKNGGVSIASRVWIVGDISNWLDGPKTPIELAEDSGNEGVFTYSGNFASGYLKFFQGDTPAWATNTWLTPPTNAAASVNCLIENDPVSLTTALGANKSNGSWHIVHPGDYTITVDLAANTVEFVRTSGGDITIGEGFDVWAVGASAAWNWSGTSNKMTSSDGVIFTWTGSLAAAASEGVSFATSDTDTGSPAWSGGKWYVAASTGQAVQNVAGDQSFAVAISGSQNPMFSVAAAGNYTITLDTNAMTVKFVKNDYTTPPEPPSFPEFQSTTRSNSIALIGNGITDSISDHTLSWTTPPAALAEGAYMFAQGENVYAWKGVASNSNSQFRLYAGSTSWCASGGWKVAVNSGGLVDNGEVQLAQGTTGIGIQKACTIIVWYYADDNLIKIQIVE